MLPELKLELGHPTITKFERRDLGDGDYAIFATTVEELVFASDNTAVLDAQLRALTQALQNLTETKAKGQNHASNK